MNEVLEYAIKSLNKEIYQLEIALAMNEYSIGQRRNLENKLVRLNEQMDRFRKIEVND